MDVQRNEHFAQQFLIRCLFNANRSVEFAYDVAIKKFPRLQKDVVEGWYRQLEQESSEKTQKLEEATQIDSNATTSSSQEAKPTVRIPRVRTSELMRTRTLKRKVLTGSTKPYEVPASSLEKIQHKIKDLEFCLDSDSVTMWIHFEHANGEGGEKEPYFLLVSYSYPSIDDAFPTIEELLGTPNMELNKLTITYDDETCFPEAKFKKYYDGILSVFGRLKSKLHVKKLVVNVETENILEGILNGIKPETLRQLKNKSDTEYCMDMSKIVELEHWKYIERLHLKGSAFIPIRKLSSIQRVFVDLEADEDEDQDIGIQDVEDYVGQLMNLEKPSHYVRWYEHPPIGPDFFK